MALNERKRAVGVFSRYEDAEAAFNELKAAGFSINDISILGSDVQRHQNISKADVNAHRTMGDAAATPTTETYQDGTRAGEGAATGALAGGAVGGLIGLIEGLTALTLPGIGPVLVGGAIVTIVANALAGGAIGAAAGGLVGALVGLGIPEERARIYNERISIGHYLLLVEGSETDIRRAETILTRRGIDEWDIYNLPGEPIVDPTAMQGSRTGHFTTPHIGTNYHYNRSGR